MTEQRILRLLHNSFSTGVQPNALGETRQFLIQQAMEFGKFPRKCEK